MPLFAADNTGATAVQELLVAQSIAAARFGEPLILPPGDYLITDAPTGLPEGCALWAPHGARFVADRTGNMLWLPAGADLQGLTFLNTGATSPEHLRLLEDATNVSVTGCAFLGTSTATPNAIIVDAAGVSGLRITDCRFDYVGYGILTSTGANDLTDVVVEGCTFTRVYDDAIEFNHPAAGAPAAAGFHVTNNTISVPATLGSSSQSGFGIGVAGVADVTITGNTIVESRNDAIHIEDASTRITVVGNTVRQVSAAAHAAIGVYPDGSSAVAIGDNVVDTVDGHGIQVVYDTSTDLVSDVTVVGNVVRSPSGNGIDVGADTTEGGRYLVADNLVRDAAGHGIRVLGTLDEILVHDNLITGCGDYGVALETNGGTTARVRSFRGNVITACASGDYQGVGISSGNATVVADRRALVDASALSVGTEVTVPFMRLGRYAHGTVTIHARRIGAAGTRIDTVWRVRWDGTALTAHRVAHDINGVISVDGLKMVNGKLAAVVYLGAANLQVEASAEFSGVSVEDGTAYATTVTGADSVVTGSRGGNAALSSLLTALADLGLITNSTSA